MKADFVIVGGGIGGTVLAELISQADRVPIVLEKSVAPPSFVRPEILWPATTEVLFPLIREEKLKHSVLPLRGVEVHDGREVFPLFTPELIKESGIQPWSTDPNKTREHLLTLPSFEVFRGMEVTSVLKKGNRVIGVEAKHVVTGEVQEFFASYTIGDDGVHSRVREACGIELQTEMFPLDLLCFGFDWPKALKPATGRVWLNTDMARTGIFALLAVPLPDEKGAGVIGVRPKIFEPGFPVNEAWDRFCSRDATIKKVTGERKFPHDFTRVRRPWGHAARYGAEGAILIGDAAHPVTPVGGQGANMSVADARVLAELIAHNEPDLLAKYEARRRPANERSLAFSRRASQLWSLPDWCFPPWVFKAALNYIRRRSYLPERLLDSASTAFLESGIPSPA